MSPIKQFSKTKILSFKLIIHIQASSFTGTSSKSFRCGGVGGGGSKVNLVLIFGLRLKLCSFDLKVATILVQASSICQLYSMTLFSSTLCIQELIYWTVQIAHFITLENVTMIFSGIFWHFLTFLGIAQPLEPGMFFPRLITLVRIRKIFWKSLNLSWRYTVGQGGLLLVFLLSFLSFYYFSLGFGFGLGPSWIKIPKIGLVMKKVCKHIPCI